MNCPRRSAAIVIGSGLTTFAGGQFVNHAAGGLLVVLVILASPFVLAITVFGWCAIRGIDPGQAGKYLIEVIRLFVRLFRRDR